MTVRKFPTYIERYSAKVVSLLSFDPRKWWSAWGNIKIMRRREFFSFAAVGAAIAPQVSAAKQNPSLAAILKELEGAIREELPGVSRVEITCRPDDPAMPLMVFAYRD